MTRPSRARVVLTHRPDAEQLYQAVVELDSIYPESAAETCRKEANAALREMVADIAVEVVEE